MSASPTDSQQRSTIARLGRAGLASIAIIVVVSSTSAVADLEEANVRDPLRASAVVPLPAVTSTTAPNPPPITTSTSPPPPAVTPSPPSVEQVDACRRDGVHEPTGTTGIVAAGEDTGLPGSGAARLLRYRIEIERGLKIDSACFAETIDSVLNDPRGWGAGGAVGFERVDDDSAEFRLILASPSATDELCYPAATGGKYSCRNREKVVLNLKRWEAGAEGFRGDTSTYRTYLVNHEVGHLLGHGHVSCEEPGTPAPVMMQQTKGLAECSPNGWPTDEER